MGNEQYLIPFNKRSQSESRAIQAKGGAATKGIPRYGMTLCKSCKLTMCPLKSQGTEEGWKCKAPDHKRIILEAAVNPEKMIEILHSRLFELDTMARSFREKKDSFYAALNLKKEVSPVTQRVQVSHAHITWEDLKQAYGRTHGSGGFGRDHGEEGRGDSL